MTIWTRLLLWATRLILAALRAIAFRRRRAWRSGTRALIEVMIQCGERGLSLIEYEEVVTSAREFFGPDQVDVHAVSDSAHYIRATRRRIRTVRPKLMWIDPRTGAQTWVKGVVQSVILSVILHREGVIPLVWLTDLQVRRWRLQADVLASAGGVILTMASPREAAKKLACDRVIGPMPLPISQETLRRLNSEDREQPVSTRPRVRFTGSLYSPRAEFLEEVSRLLEGEGIHLEVSAHSLGGERSSNADYWRRLLDSDIVLTTAHPSRLPGQDRSDSPHLVFRFAEALAAGSMLVAPFVAGSAHLFRPGLDFVAFRTASEAAAAISLYLSEPDARRQIADSGKQRMTELIEENWFWCEVKRSLEAQAQISRN